MKETIEYRGKIIRITQDEDAQSPAGASQDLDTQPRPAFHPPTIKRLIPARAGQAFLAPPLR